VPLPCLDENTIVAFAEGRLDAPAVAQVDDHLATCPDCRRLAAAGLALRTRDRSKETATQADATVAVPRGVGTLPRGTVVGRYTLLELAGRGGMGEVYAAFDPEMDRRVALKILAERRHHESRAKARLLREARALAKLSHPNVVAVHELGTFGDRVFVAMEFVDGPTLKAWLDDRPRSIPEILAAFTQAARGLAAAHAVGLVHRDFKPDNVMIARDGAARVLDFGLVRRVGDEPRATWADGDIPTDAPVEGETASDVTAVLQLTKSGAILGTPRYMAPEQLRAAALDARTDQFSFCVTLYEALYGEPPFGNGRLSQVIPEVLAGRVRPAPAKSAVPAWLRRVIVRGLSVDPDARWPSMQALVAALNREPTRRWRRLALAGAVGMVALSVVTLARGSRGDAAVCRGGPPRIAGAWEPPARAGVARARHDAARSAILSSGATAAPDIWDRLEVLLDRYAVRWLEMYDDACRATHFRHEQTAAVLDLRMACLDERRTALGALTSLLGHADRDVTVNAINAANALPLLDSCGDITALQTAVAPPADEPTRRKANDLRKRAADAKALFDTGKKREAVVQMKGLIVEAELLGYKPLLGELLTSRAAFRGGAGFLPEGVTEAEEAVWTDLAAARDDLAAEAAINLVGMEGVYRARPAASARWSKLAQALLERAGGSHDLLWAWLLQNEAVIDMRSTPNEGVLERLRRSIALKEKVLGPQHPDVAHGLNSIAEALHRMGKNSDALSFNAQALRLFTKAYGPRSTEACAAGANRGEYLVALGRSDEALPILTEAVGCWATQNGPDSQFGAYPLTDLGLALLSLEHPRPVDAVRTLEHALRAREAHEPDPRLVAETRFAMAQALWTADSDRKRAVGLATKAAAAYARENDTANARTVTTWLGEHATGKKQRE
jgi:tetratricopeptide (TPR) repeat protein